MPRQPRLEIPGIPQHVVQRGNDRQPCFFREEDYRRYLSELTELALRRECTVRAYVQFKGTEQLSPDQPAGEPASKAPWQSPFLAFKAR